MMASRSANVEAPQTAGVQVTEGPLAAEVPAGVFFPHPGALSSNAGADAGDTNGASAGDTNVGALCELLVIRLQCIYNFLLFHPIILPLLDVYGLYFTHLYHFWD